MKIARRFARPVGHGLILAGLLFMVYLFVVVAPQMQNFHHDAFAYWNVNLPDAYSIPVGDLGAFNYAPPVALVFDSFSLVDWWVFSFLWLMLLVGSVIWIGWTPNWILAALAFPFVALEFYGGNIHILLVVAIVLGFRHPWTWSFVLLTKPSAGIGLLWFVVRGEWRQLGIALAATAVLCVASLVLMPSLWAEWVDLILDNVGRPPVGNAVMVPLWIRLTAAAALVVWGARTDRRWTVVVASMVALPILWLGSFVMLVGIVPELRARSLAAGREALASPATASVPGTATAP